MDQNQVVEYVRVTQEALKRASARVAALEGAEKAAAAAAGPLVEGAIEALVASGLMRPTQKEAAARALSTREGALRTLAKLGGMAVPRRLAEAPEPIGAPVPDPTKQASAGAVRSEAAEAFTRQMLALRNRG